MKVTSKRHGVEILYLIPSKNGMKLNDRRHGKDISYHDKDSAGLCE